MTYSEKRIADLKKQIAHAKLVGDQNAVEQLRAELWALREAF